ncbi:VOC family protein, partial [Mesorhizobium sp. M00.F.Ca.ET.158.01.1.1]
ARFPAALITVGDIHAEFDRLTGRGVKFLGPPERTGPVTSAFFDDTCGNFIVMAEPSA